MKLIKTAIAILGITLFSVSCKKDDSSNQTVYKEENFLNSYLTQSTVTLIDADSLPGQESESGILFTPLVNGKINSVEVKLPASNNNVRLTIWDVVSGTPVKTEYLTVSAGGTLTAKVISGLTLVKDKQYAISINSYTFYGYTRANKSYPLTCGNIRVDNYGYHSGTTQSFISNFLDYRYRGLVGFNFQQTD